MNIYSYGKAIIFASFKAGLVQKERGGEKGGGIRGAGGNKASTIRCDYI